ncbi:MAG: hypothetical protein AB7P21_06020 [Lautropia sp.]
MADILGLGLSHYPPLSLPDDRMSGILRYTLEDPAIPAAQKDPANWPDAMRREWADDGSVAAAATHRGAMVSALAAVRRALDAFQPDAVLIWGDDQYENFREDVVPAFTVCAYPDLDFEPWRQAQRSSMAEGGKPNVWNEGPDKRYRVRGHQALGRYLAGGLIEAGIDVAYAYRPLHHEGFAHAFGNAILYLDYARAGWPWPTVTVPINCYGRRVISCKGFLTRFDDPVEFDPPSPSPARCMALGAETARLLRASPWRVAVIASSSWSHAFLCDQTWRLRPDTVADRALYDAMLAGDYARWRETPLASFEKAGQQEVLNWCPLLGAMETIGARLAWSEFVETAVFNSNKVFAVYEAA